MNTRPVCLLFVSLCFVVACGDENENASRDAVQVASPPPRHSDVVIQNLESDGFDDLADRIRRRRDRGGSEEGIERDYGNGDLEQQWRRRDGLRRK